MDNNGYSELTNVNVQLGHYQTSFSSDPRSRIENIYNIKNSYWKTWYKIMAHHMRRPVRREQYKPFGRRKVRSPILNFQNLLWLCDLLGG